MMDPDDIDRVEVWFAEWYAHMRTLGCWPEMRDRANTVMDEAERYIERMRGINEADSGNHPAD